MSSRDLPWRHTPTSSLNMMLVSSRCGCGYPTQIPSDGMPDAIGLMKKYGPGTSYDTKYWEIGNEPNMPPSSTTKEGLAYAKKFAGYYEEMVREVRKAGVTGVQFLLPGLFGFKAGKPGRITPREFLREVKYQLDHAEPKLANPYQGISIHPYVFKVRDPKHPKKGLHAPGTVKGAEAEDAEQLAKEVQRSISNVHGIDPGAPIWVTELGFPVKSSDEAKIPRVSESEQAILVRQSFAMLLRKRKHLNIDHVLYYNIQDVSNGAEWPNHCGLLKASRAQRPAWKAFTESVEAE
ncbi:MAG: hypothetical protein JSU06_00325 [Actinobacteria bacterium]|nr:hypothetical protein [Actinomycetota bacterium]